jgi:hypothetical protein
MQTIQNIFSEQDRSRQKLMGNIEQLQAAAAMDAAGQRQEVAGGVADIANQIAGGMQRLQEEKKAREEGREKVRLQEDLMQFEQKLNQESQQEATRIGLMMKQSEEATMQEVKRWESKAEDTRTNHNATVTAFHDILKSGAFRRMPNGYKAMHDIHEAIKMSEAYVEDQTSPAYISHAMNLMHQAQRDIAAGRDPMDLAAMYDRPVTAPFEGIRETGKNVNTLDGKTRFRMALRKGYPEEGIFAVTEDDPRREHINLVTPDVLAQLLVDNATYTTLISDEARTKFEDHTMRKLDEADRRLAPMAESYEKVSTMMDKRAPEAIRRGLHNFTIKGTGQDVGRELFDTILGEMFPQGGPQISKLAGELRDRTAALDTPLEFGAAMSLEAAAWAVEENAIKTLAFVAGGEGKAGGTPLLAGMAEQVRGRLSPAEMTRLFGPGVVDERGEWADGTGVIKAQTKLQEALESVKAYAGEVRMAANETGAVNGFTKEFGKNSRLRDIYLYKYFTGRGDEKEKAKNMLYGDVQKRAGEMQIGDLQNLEVADSPEIGKYHNILDSMLEFVGVVGPDQLPKVAALLSGGQVDLTDGNVAAFNAGAQTMTERSDYMKLSRMALQDQRELVEIAKKSREQGVPMAPEQMLSEKKARADRRASFAEQLRRAKGSGGVSGAFRQGVFAAGAAGAEVGAGLSGTQGPYTGQNYGGK